MAKKAKVKKQPSANPKDKLRGKTQTPLQQLQFIAALERLHRALNGGSLEGFKLGDQVYHEGTPGVPNPEIAPFLTPDDIMEKLAFDQSRDEAFRNADASLAAAKADRDYNLKNVHDQFLKSTSSATDEMIGRGLFQSSVKDAALYDLEAQRALQETYLNSAFKNQEIAAQSVKDAYLGQGGYQETFDTALGQKMVENAQSITPTDQWKVAPTAGGFAPGPNAKTGAQPPKPLQAKFGPPRTSGPQRTTLGVGKQMTMKKVPQKNPRDRLAAGRGR